MIPTGLAGASMRVPPPPAGLPGSDPAELARVGEAVRARLDAAPAARRLPALNMDMYFVPNLVSPEECAELVRMIDADAAPSQILRSSADPEFRTSWTCVLQRSIPLVERVEARIADLLGIPLSHSETLQGQRYQPGQQFKAHSDYFTGGRSYSEAVASEGGQRSWTAMLFLNQPESGGATEFARASVRVPPRTGALLAWNNLTRDGQPNPYTRHEGTRVLAGSKYVLTKWFRERAWRKSEATEGLGS